MAFMDSLRRFIAAENPAETHSGEFFIHREREVRRAKGDSLAIQTRAIDSYTTYPGWTEQMLAAQGLSARPWRYPSINEALGVPAIFRAVSLIANTTGSLAVETFRKGVKLSDDDAPRLVKRPDPFKTPRTFYRDTAFYLATRGEAWWWVAARDFDDSPLSLIVVPPWEVTVTANRRDRLRPKIEWLGKEMLRQDMRQITFLPDDSGLRGVGPLQMCGAAVSVAVEAQEWAANFFIEDGGHPSILIKATGVLGEDEEGNSEADVIRDQWMSKPHNTPRVIDEGIDEVKEVGVNAQGAQMLQARDYQNGDAARMFGIPGSLLDFGGSGSSITYQTVAEEYTKFVRTCLAPNYLEGIEQEMSDLLPRSTVARFAVKGLQRADPKTRAEVAKILVDIGVVSPEEVRIEEGYGPGDVEFAPVPFSPPAAFPANLPTDTRSAPTVVPAPSEVRCDGTRVLRGVLRPCGKKLAEAPPFIGRCPRCGKEFEAVA